MTRSGWSVSPATSMSETSVSGMGLAEGDIVFLGLLGSPNTSKLLIIGGPLTLVKMMSRRLVFLVTTTFFSERVYGVRHADASKTSIFFLRRLFAFALNMRLFFLQDALLNSAKPRVTVYLPGLRVIEYIRLSSAEIDVRNCGGSERRVVVVVVVFAGDRNFLLKFFQPEIFRRENVIRTRAFWACSCGRRKERASRGMRT